MGDHIDSRGYHGLVVFDGRDGKDPQITRRYEKAH